MATRKYWVLTDTKPAVFRQEADTKAQAYDEMASITEPTFVQSYINGKPGLSWTRDQLANSLGM